MAETNIDYEEQREQVAEVAMQMILHAGDARELIMKALDAVGQGRYEAVSYTHLDVYKRQRISCAPA